MSANGGRLDWDAFDRRLRALLAEYAPVAGTVNDDDGLPSDDVIEPPFVVGDFVVAAVFEDTSGSVFTSHFRPNDSVRYRIRGLVDLLDRSV